MTAATAVTAGAAATSSVSPALELRGIVKRFPGVLANDHIDLSVERGEIRALLGENGAGKTTLMRVLYGLYPPDAGEIQLAGQTQHFRSPTDAIEAGLGMVHQHFMLFPSLTVAENIVYGREPRRWGFIDRRTAARQVAALAERYGLEVDPGARVADLSVGLRQRVEILKTLYRDAQVLILDEPTAVLTPQERQGLFRVLRELAGQGKTVIFITHKLQEVMEIADRATVLRNGRVEATVRIADSSPTELCRYMVGRDVLPDPIRTPKSAGDPVLTVADLVVLDNAGRRVVDGVSFEVRAGEIVGLAGVAGNGQSELVAAIAGLRSATAGRVMLSQQDANTTSIAARRRAGLAYIPEDRNRVGLALAASVADNLIMADQRNSSRTPRLSKRGVLSRAGIERYATDLIERFDIKVASTREAVGNLSGGNRQKVVAARELAQEPIVLIAEQPTQGVDVGAAESIHRDLLAVRDAGRAVLLSSAESSEILSLCDRILVMFEGRIVGELSAEAVGADPAAEATLGLLAAGGAT